jgi:hypothetical protein
MPQFDSYPEATITSTDKVLFFKNSASAVKSIQFSNLATSIKNAIASFFTPSAVVPSSTPVSGQILVGNATNTAYAAKTVIGDASLGSDGTLTIGSNKVTYAKMQDVSAASKLLGRGSASGSGDTEEIALGTGLSMSGTTLNVSAGTGNVSQSVDATAADHVFVSGAADKSRVETPVTIDPSTGDVDGIGDLDVDSVTTPEIAISATHASDDTFHGITITDLDAGENLAQWDLVYLAVAGTWFRTDAGDPYTGAFPARGVVVETVTTGNPAKVLILGSARNDAWAWTPGVDIWMSTTAGGYSQVVPSGTGDEIQKVGFALSADVAFFSFGAGNTATAA